ncbi:MAG: FAD-dependent oxidoreductase [Verrucomicrobia bacterium]|nr:FAD-dependent oxidoreductase [Verrucomicrobiota bacterium]NBU10749.1 FAD-dependent oxidoreductase [Pseudomonadota bacterium]NDA66166.1 FAD-dependent oxidoreductase [Verrucomicrobiota bacterium]NDB76503.1 FAD-dependent oxidoreductase [Verrucomicrobiota bacterium]NDD37942.1 FAD-dependent oxidoreductase [Verrucomicrobiota bacterium]
MKFSWFHAPVFSLALLGVAAANAQVVEADVCVFGGTSGGIAAAVQTARMGKRAVLVNPTKFLGGLTTGGLGATDIGNKAAIGGLSRDYYHRLAQHYAKDTAWTLETAQDYFAKRRGGQAGASSLGGADATMWTFEPHVAEQVYLQLLDEAKTPVFLDQRLKSVTKAGPHITEITMESGRVFRAKMFVDATYEGDLLAKAGCSFHVGREANAVYGETLNGVRAQTPHHQFTVPVGPYVKPGDASSGLLPFIQPGDGGKPGDGDKATQAYNYRLCFTTDPKNRLPAQKPAAMPQSQWDALLKAANNSLPVTPPPNYDAKEFELLGRYLEALVAAKKSPKLAHFWNPIWMPNHKTDINNNGGFSTDFIGRNYDYPNADYATRERIAKEHEHYIRGFLTFLATDPRVPEDMRKEMQSWGPSKDEFRSTDGWPREMYVREARRLVGEYVMSEKNCRAVETITDSVGLGAYNMDSHNCQRIVKNGKVENEGDVQVPPMKPYPVSYRAIIPKAAECDNLLVPVCLSSSHIAYGSIRMEPVFMVLGQSAATAAAIAIDDKVPVQKVNYEKLRARLVADKQVLDWTGGGGASGSGKFVDPKSLPGIVLDDADAKQTGHWTESFSSVWRVGRGYAHDGNASKGESTAVFTPDIASAGEYEIILFNAPNPNRASNVPVTVSVPGQPAKTVKVDQKSKGEISLGKFQLPAGRAATVTVSNKDTDGYVILDGVQFKPVK